LARLVISLWSARQSSDETARPRCGQTTRRAQALDTYLGAMEEETDRQGHGRAARVVLVFAALALIATSCRPEYSRNRFLGISRRLPIHPVVRAWDGVRLLLLPGTQYGPLPAEVWWS
jgi:hypothetical protein